MAGRLLIVGDIHGCRQELEILVEALAPASGDVLVCLGDYVDRGPDARGVIDRLLELRGTPGLESVFLRGNHEDMLLSYLGRGGHYGEAFLANGGEATLRSYGLRESLSADRLEGAIPPIHLEFLEATRLSHLARGHLMVHAGIDPRRPLDRQEPHDLIWIRDTFISQPHSLGVTVVFGHTPMRDVLVDLPYKIGIDTGCVYGGRLTALEVPAMLVHSVSSGGGKMVTRGLLA